MQMGAVEFHAWMAFYQLEKEDLDAEIEEAKQKAQEEAERNK